MSLKRSRQGIFLISNGGKVLFNVESSQWGVKNDHHQVYGKSLSWLPISRYYDFICVHCDALMCFVLQSCTIRLNQGRKIRLEDRAVTMVTESQNGGSEGRTSIKPNFSVYRYVWLILFLQCMTYKINLFTPINFA